jgi:hypothetical protein
MHNKLIPPLLDVESKRFLPGGGVNVTDPLDQTAYENMGYRPSVFEDITTKSENGRKPYGGSRRRRRPSRKYKKSAKRVFRKKSRSTRRR